MLRNEIPAAVIAVVVEIVSQMESHATLDGLFTYAGAIGDPPEGSKHAKAMEWLRRTNRSQEVISPLTVLGRIIESYMEAESDPFSWDHDPKIDERKQRLQNVLGNQGLEYLKGGTVVQKGHSVATKSLQEVVLSRDYASVTTEFERAVRNVDNEPREAVSAAANILESICKVYIEEKKLTMPAKQDLKPVWQIVRKDLGLDPSILEDNDLKVILTSVFGVVEGIAALRTHASSAHGSGKKVYRLEPRHARLAVHAAHTLGLFILETWDVRDDK